MAWVETASMSFTARHEAGQGDAALAALDSLERHRARLEELFPRVPGGVTLVLHDSALQLSLAHPYLPIARLLTAPAGRRYMAGWFSSSEVHVLSPHALRKRAAGEDSLRAMLLTQERYYTLLVVGANNPLLPPPFRPASFARLLRLAWLAEGAAQYFSGQLAHMRPAIARRLREHEGKSTHTGTRHRERSRRARSASFPPARRDAALLGGTVFDLLARERGVRACVRLACHPHSRGAPVVLEDAFELPFAEVERRWHSHLESLAAPETPPRVGTEA